MSKTAMSLFIAILFLILIFLTVQALALRELQYKYDSQAHEIKVLLEDKQLLYQENSRVNSLLIYIIEEIESKERKAILELRDFLLGVETNEFEITAYAPLDPNAIEGMCYEGDPSVTASGGRPIPGETAAAGPSIPFGSRVFLVGYGWRTINDRGGMITDKHIDLVATSHEEAWMIGRQIGVRGLVLP